MSEFTVGGLRTTRRPSVRAAVIHAAAVFREMWRARATRRLLASLDDQQLADIGVGRGDALDESLRPMWDLAPRRR